MAVMAPMLNAVASAVGLSWKFAPPFNSKHLRRYRAQSDCSTTADSNSADSGSECDSSPRSPAVAELNLEASTVIMLDWDDTLLPTTSIRNRPSTMSRTNRLDLDAKLRRHAAQVELVLRAARSVAHVSIVTLSKRGWVPKSAGLYLPGLDIQALLRELDVTVYYAQEDSDNCPGALAAEDWTSLKRSAMARCLDDWLAAGVFRKCNLDGTSPDFVSVVSVGDSVAEQQAAMSLTGSAAGVVPDKQLLCKTLKLMDQPTLEQLGEELLLLPALLRTVAACDTDVDLTARNPSELASCCRALKAGAPSDLEAFA